MNINFDDYRNFFARMSSTGFGLSADPINENTGILKDSSFTCINVGISHDPTLKYTNNNINYLCKKEAYKIINDEHLRDMWIDSIIDIEYFDLYCFLAGPGSWLLSLIDTSEYETINVYIDVKGDTSYEKLIDVPICNIQIENFIFHMKRFFELCYYKSYDVYIFSENDQVIYVISHHHQVCLLISENSHTIGDIIIELEECDLFVKLKSIA